MYAGAVAACGRPGGTVTLTPSDVRRVRFRAATPDTRGYDEPEVDAFLERVANTLDGKDRLTAQDVRAPRLTAGKRRRGGYRADDVDAFLDEVALALEQGSRPASATRDTAASTITGPPANISRRGSQRPGIPLDARSRRPPVPAPPDDIEPALAAPQGRPSGFSRQAGPGTPSPTAWPQSDARDRQHVAFLSPPPGEPACNADEVDRFLDRIHATLAGEDTLTAHDVLTATFDPPPPGLRGYGEAGVMAFLVLAAHSLQRLASPTEAPTKPSIRPCAPPPRRTSPSGAEVAKVSRRAPSTARPDDTPLPGAGDIYHAAAIRRRSAASTYDPNEVDGVLNRIRATLAGQDTLTAEDVLTVTFNPPPPGTRGYTETEFLALLAAALDPPIPATHAPPAAPPEGTPPPLRPEAIHNVRFHGPPLGQRGYHEDEVDAFLDRVEATLAGQDTLTAQDVHDVRFHEVSPEHGGYNQDEVETLLDLVAQQLGGEVSHRWHA
jgi:DivIVA domain-containing protein